MSGKLFLGHRLRRLRRDHDLSQTDMAARLAISPSYLNHLERNQRPVTAPLLLKLAELYDIDMRAFASGGGTRTGPDELGEIFSDALLADLGVPRYELAELAHNAPSVADAIARLYAALKETARNPDMAGNGDARALITRLHPAAPQPLSGAGTGRRNPGRSAQRSLVHGRTDAAPAQGRLGN
jgi:transcriptional regulator with XRE-family HTH domain